ncbi:MAG: dTDP-4-dehydrorhamnose 3,5-epimerase [Pseudomonadota bacterium]
MKFTPSPLAGAYLIEPELLEDDRGFFARAFCREEYESHGLNPDVMQGNISFNHVKGTVRGMHYQLPPHREVKVVRCTRGAIYDAIVDLRPDSSTYLQVFGAELSAENHRQLYVPEGFAHGYQTLEDNCEVSYQVSQFYAPGSERGVRWNDSAFKLEWPLPVSCISDKDQAHPEYEV